jgi:maltooligosyltrehalose trehalohydrolase
VHHVLHTAVTAEGSGYYQDYVGDTDKLGRALAEGFAFQGETMTCTGRARGEPSASLPPSAFVAFIQNHDQIGNRAFGERIGHLVSAEALRAIAAVYLLLPQVPMLFMGEEWSASAPFPFFCDFAGELGEAVRKGRREEFGDFPEFKDPARRAAIPDPQADATFLSAKLDWDERERDDHAQWHEWYRRILRVRAAEIVPRCAALERGGRYEVLGERAVRVRWQAGRHELVLDANLSERAVVAPALPSARAFWTEGTIDAHTFGAWSVRWALVDPST